MAVKVCILCGASGPLTREHIWPQWFSKLNPGREYSLETIVGKSPAIYRDTGSLDLQPRILCGDCNHRWGSLLEDAVRPGLTSMAVGNPRLITLPLARQLATWATLKITAGQYLPRPKKFIPFFTEQHRLTLRNQSAPPDGVFLWIGRYIGSRHQAGWILGKESAREDEDDATIGILRYSATYSIGQVLFQLLGIHAVPFIKNEQREGGTIHIYNPITIGAAWSKALIPIWPLPDKAFLWPPKQAFDDKGFDAAAARWHKEKPPRRTDDGPPP